MIELHMYSLGKFNVAIIVVVEVCLSLKGVLNLNLIDGTKAFYFAVGILLVTKSGIFITDRRRSK
jgi:hypothetical protein